MTTLSAFWLILNRFLWFLDEKCPVKHEIEDEKGKFLWSAFNLRFFIVNQENFYALLDEREEKLN